MSNDEWDAFANLWHPFSAKRKEVLTCPGEQEKYLYFVVEGTQRVFYFDEKNREATVVFTFSPSFGGVLDSIMLRNESRYYYETLTPSSFLRASVHGLHELMDAHPNIQAMILKGVSHALSGIIERLVELQALPAEERLRNLIKRSPHILHHIPHKYLANYLGIDPTNFSKFINGVRF